MDTQLKFITETVYKQPDGTIITDTLDVSAIAPCVSRIV